MKYRYDSIRGMETKGYMVASDDAAFLLKITKLLFMPLYL